jgi:hypothetical protein
VTIVVDVDIVQKNVRLLIGAIMLTKRSFPFILFFFSSRINPNIFR